MNSDHTEVTMSENMKQEKNAPYLQPVQQHHRPMDLVFKNLNLSVNTKQGSKKILDDVSGYVQPGQILGVMGPSGSGKTTLLNVLSGRLKADCGCITLNGESINKQLRRRMCYVLQQDIFFPDLTLRQTLMYTALLRLPESLSYAEKMHSVDHIIDALDLRSCQYTIIGDISKRGLSGGEKKRANIACELLTNPTIMLLDEPTSGLDSSTAHGLMLTLKEYAVKERKTIIATVHQPSSQIFYMFDKLLLLSSGQPAYFGHVNDVVPFFTKIGFQIASHYNPADFVMEKLKHNEDVFIAAAKQLQKHPTEHEENEHNQSSYQTNESQVGHMWSNEDDYEKPKSLELRVVMDPCCKSKVYSKIVNDDDSGRSSWSDIDRSSTATFSTSSTTDEIYYSTHRKWPTCFWTQLRVLTQRNFHEARHRMLSKLNWVQTVVLAIVAGLIWFQVPRTENTLTDTRGWMFFTTTYWMLFALFSALVSFPQEREVINKERSSGDYRLSSYYIAKMIGELPLTITLPSIFHLISYPMLGTHSFSTFFSLWAFLILSTVVAQSVGLFIGAACVDLEVSVTISALYSLSTMLFAGFYSTSMPGWLAWMRYASMVYYAFLNMQMVEFSSGPTIMCSPTNSQFESCSSNSTTSAVQFDELVLYLDNMGQRAPPFPIWINTAILLLFLISFRVAGYVVLRYYRKPK